MKLEGGKKYYGIRDSLYLFLFNYLFTKPRSQKPGKAQQG